MRYEALIFAMAWAVVAADAAAQVCEDYNHAMKSGWKRLSRQQLQYAVDDFTEAMEVHAKTAAEKVDALFGKAEAYRQWRGYNYPKERFEIDPAHHDLAREAYAKILAMADATPDQRGQAHIGMARCFAAQNRFAEAIGCFGQALATSGLSAKVKADAQSGQEACRQLAQGADATPELMRQAAPTIEFRYRSQWPPYGSAGKDAEVKPFASDSLGGTLARDHQSRAMYFAGQHRRTYVAYMDHHFMARVTYYDHDKRQWAWRPAIVDSCQQAYCFKDGHNAPNIFVSRDGTIHLFYGSHNGSLRYARSAEPERIDRFEIGRRIGRKITYPYLCQTTEGELLLFYRRGGPRGGYNHGNLSMRSSSDNGDSWSDIHILLRVQGGAKLCNNAVVYNPVRQRVHLSTSVKSDKGWNTYYLEYDLATKRTFSLDGTDLGTSTTEAALNAAGGKVLGGDVEYMFGRDGVLFLAGRDANGGRYVGRWDGKQFAHHVIPGGQVGCHKPTLFTSDGQRLHLYGLTTESDSRQASLVEWTSPDGGKTWQEGKMRIGPDWLGHGLQTLNLVMNYSGSGPVLIVAEPTGVWPEGWVRTGETHYDNPARRDKRLYAVDADGGIVSLVRPSKQQ